MHPFSINTPFKTVLLSSIELHLNGCSPILRATATPSAGLVIIKEGSGAHRLLFAAMAGLGPDQTLGQQRHAHRHPGNDHKPVAQVDNRDQKLPNTGPRDRRPFMATPTASPIGHTRNAEGHDRQRPVGRSWQEASHHH